MEQTNGQIQLTAQVSNLKVSPFVAQTFYRLTSSLAQ